MMSCKYKDADSHIPSDCLQKFKSKLLLKVSLVFVGIDLSLKNWTKIKDTERLSHWNLSVNWAQSQYFLSPLFVSALFCELLCIRFEIGTWRINRIHRVSTCPEMWALVTRNIWVLLFLASYIRLKKIFSKFHFSLEFGSLVANIWIFFF